ncbi:MAG: PaaI family thioesterase [Deltaproteobacteria bacterium]|nr:PaaI family thioesterase [Deltaproteobacteria bacterium]
MEEIKRFFTQDRYAAHSGIELVSVSPGHAVAQMRIQPYHFNAVGRVQGGAIFTLADLAFAAASNAHGKAAVAINVSITYMSAAASGTLRAEARELTANPKLASYTVNVTDDSGTLVAVFQGLTYRKDQTLPWVAKG